MKKRYNEYPANLLAAMKVNEIMGSDLDYENLSEDQMQGLTYALSALTEREMIVLTENYKEEMSVKAIADMHYLTESRVKGIKRDALKKEEIYAAIAKSDKSLDEILRLVLE